MSHDAGATFRATQLQAWEIAACPMSSFSLARAGVGVFAAWETAGRVFWARVDAAEPRVVVIAPGATSNRKHPSIAVNERGDVLLAWTEGTGWNKGGGLAWQMFTSTGAAIGETSRAPGVPVWSLAAVAARPDGSFVLLY
jgi:hypothetical protein